MRKFSVNDKCDNMAENIEEGETVEEKVDEEENGGSTLISDLSELSIFLNENPNIEPQVSKIIDYHLKDGVNDKTFESIKTGLEILLGTEAGRFTVAALSMNSNNFFDSLCGEIEEMDLTKPLIFLRHLTALYGSKVDDAYSLISEISDDWQNGYVDLYCKGENEAWYIDMDLQKYNGERIYLRMPPHSAFDLAQALVKEMGKLPKESVDMEIIEEFRDETEDFKKKFLV